MPDLIAQGIEAQQRWRRPLPEGQTVVVGRVSGSWAVPWDQHISRQHARLICTENQLRVTQLSTATNPVYFRGKQSPRFVLRPGEHFVIGDTSFTLVNQRVSITVDVAGPFQQQSFSPQFLRQVPFRDPDHRIEVLSRLPEVLTGTADDQELFVRLVTMLLAGAPRADAAAIVALQGELGIADRGQGTGDRLQETPNSQQPTGDAPTAALAAGGTTTPADPSTPAGDGPHFRAAKMGMSPSEMPATAQPPVEVLHWDQRLALGGDFEPSQGLIQEAFRLRQSVLHIWRGGQRSVAQRFTESENVDWAFCTPVPTSAGQQWALYVSGRFGADMPGRPGSSDPFDPREDVKFAELVANTVGSLRRMRSLERQHATLSQFFSPVVLETLALEDPELVLSPRETTVSVLFCDLRGFSLRTEQYAHDLMGLLERVGKAMGVMTQHIRQQGGVVGDFHGDAAMGFWGWPVAHDDAVARACRAALAISAQFKAVSQEADSPLANFRAGIGLATGKAVAGKIGTVDQVKVTVFGPVVNLASRLEGMTKVLRAPILVDEATARAVRGQVPYDVARIRRVAVVKPYGLDTPLEVSELLPPQAEYPELTEEHLGYYETALDHFLAGRWWKAFELLHRIPASDRVKDFLTVFIAQHNRTPPPAWDGVIPLGTK